MSTNAKPDSTDSEQSFEPPFPEDSRGYARIEDLQPFHLEDETYVERDNADIVASIEEHGFREGERVVICPDGTILLGHRRVDGADQYGMERVPVYVEDVEPDSPEAKSIFVSSNQYRDKTPGERVNEAQILEEIERERAQERQGSREDIRQNLGGGEKGRANEKAAEQIGFSRESYRKGKYVKEGAQEGNDTAEAEWQDLMKGDQSIHGAYTIVREMEEPDEDDEDGGGADDGGDGDAEEDADEDSTDDEGTTQPTEDSESDDIDEGAESEATETSQPTQQQAQQPTTGDAGEEDEASDDGDGETDSEGTDGDESEGSAPPRTRTEALQARVASLKAEKKRSEEKAEACIDNLQNLARENIEDLKGPSRAELREQVDELERAVEMKEQTIEELDRDLQEQESADVDDYRTTLNDIIDQFDKKDIGKMEEHIDNARELVA